MEIVDMESVLNRLAPGAFLTRPYLRFGSYASVPAGTAGGAAGSKTFITETLPSGEGLLITELFFNLPDNIGGDFMFAQALINSNPIIYNPLIPGAQGNTPAAVPIIVIVPPSAVLTLVALNYSGTDADGGGTPSDSYPAATPARAFIGAKGWYYAIKS